MAIGVDAEILAALDAAVEEEGAILKLAASEIGGVQDSEGTWHEAAEKREGGPSVLFDAVAVLPSAEEADRLIKFPAAHDFIADAVSYRKFLAYVEPAVPLLKKAGVADSIDEGFVLLKGTKECAGFVTLCRKLRFWNRNAAER